MSLAALKQAAKGNSGGGSRAGYLKVSPDTSVTGRFLQELDEEAANYNPDAGTAALKVIYEDFPKKIEDTTETEGRCWPAEQGWKPKQVMYVAFLVEESANSDDIGKVMILNQGFGPKSVTLPLIEFADPDEGYGTICDRPYRIKRTGSGRTDTSYQLIPLKEDAEPYDVTPHLDQIPDWDTVVKRIPYAEQEAFFKGEGDSKDGDKVSW